MMVFVLYNSNIENLNIEFKYLSENFNENLCWRSKVSTDDVSRIEKNHKLRIVEQVIIDWNEIKGIDAISILKNNDSRILPTIK